MACVTKKKGQWIVDFYDLEGKRRAKFLPKGATKKQATKLLREIEIKLEKGTFLPSQQTPIFKEVAKKWLEYKKNNIRSSTWSVYEGHTRNHFDDLDNFLINKITTARIEKYITDRQTAKMNISTLRKLLVSIGQIMQYAVRHKYIDHNPVREAERPKDQGEAQEEKNRILTLPEIKNFIEAVADLKYQTLFKLAIFSGARQGEILGLKWSDIIWAESQIHIQRTYNNDNWYDTKTKTSNRKIDIGPSTIKMLREWKMASIPGKLNLVFSTKTGNPINHNNMVKKYFVPALEAGNIKRIRFHDLRHTYASLLIEQGENIKYIQNQLGHASPTITLNVYAHLMKSTNQASACRLEDTILNNGDQMETKIKKGVNLIG